MITKCGWVEYAEQHTFLRFSYSIAQHPHSYLTLQLTENMQWSEGETLHREQCCLKTLPNHCDWHECLSFSSCISHLYPLTLIFTSTLSHTWLSHVIRVNSGQNRGAVWFSQGRVRISNFDRLSTTLYVSSKIIWMTIHNRSSLNTFT